MIKTTDLILGSASIFAGILTILDRQLWPAGISLMVAGFVLIYFANSISKIKENNLEIKKLKEKLIIYEKLNKLELKVFGK